MNGHEHISHEQAIERLPWLVNDSLDAGERNLLLEHAGSCVICRRELAELEGLQDSIVRLSAQTAIPAPDMRRINARIDAHMERENRGQLVIAGLRDFFRNPWRLAVAAQTGVVIVLAAVLLWPEGERPEFATLTNAEDLLDGLYIRVVFNPGIAEAEIATLLEDNDLTIVAGPSDRGVYTLRVAASASVADRDAAIVGLLTRPDVLFAQPVTLGMRQ